MGNREGCRAIKESFRPDEAGISHSRTYKSSLQEPGAAPTRGHSPQEHNQAENGLALDQGTDPRWLVHRNPEEEVKGAGKDEGGQPPADLWVTDPPASASATTTCLVPPIPVMAGRSAPKSRDLLLLLAGLLEDRAESAQP